jgi:hypothetical protein
LGVWDQKDEHGIQNFKSCLCGPERETKDFGSWTQTSVTKTEGRLGVLTPFFRKNMSKKDKENQSLKKHSAIGRFRKEEDSQQDSLMVRRIRP